MDEKYYGQQTFENLRINQEEFEDYRFIDCEFINCYFEACKLNRCSFSNCSFIQCTVINLNAINFTQIQLIGLTECHLTGINWSELLPSGRFAEPIDKMEHCRLKYNAFTEMNFKKFSFSDNDIVDSIFGECQLGESDFKRCNLERTEFFRCDIRKADFRNAIGYQIDIMTSKMTGARFSFPEVTNLLHALDIKID